MFYPHLDDFLPHKYVNKALCLYFNDLWNLHILYFNTLKATLSFVLALQLLFLVRSKVLYF